MPQHKKHKTWDGDGVLVLSGGKGTLFDMDGKTCVASHFHFPLKLRSEAQNQALLRETQPGWCLCGDYAISAKQRNGSRLPCFTRRLPIRENFWSRRYWMGSGRLRATEVRVFDHIDKEIRTPQASHKQRAFAAPIWRVGDFFEGPPRNRARTG